MISIYATLQTNPKTAHILTTLDVTSSGLSIQERSRSDNQNQEAYITIR